MSAQRRLIEIQHTLKLSPRVSESRRNNKEDGPKKKTESNNATVIKGRRAQLLGKHTQ